MFVIGLVIAFVVAVVYFAWEHARSTRGRMRGMRGDQWRRETAGTE